MRPWKEHHFSKTNVNLWGKQSCEVDCEASNQSRAYVALLFFALKNSAVYLDKKKWGWGDNFCAFNTMDPCKYITG